MELEEDLNLKILDEVKRAYLQTCEQLRNGISNTTKDNLNKQEQQQQMQVEDKRMTIIYKFQSIHPIPLLINEKTGGRRQIFCGEYLYGKSKIKLQLIGKSLEIESNMINMFRKPQQCYVLYNVQIFELVLSSQLGSHLNQQYSPPKSTDIYYVLDDESQILEDESMDYISSLTRLSDSFTQDESIFETSYSSQISQMQKPLNMTHFRLLQPKVIGSFEGVILQVSEGKNLLQIEELIDQINLNSKRDRFYVLKVASGKNYTDVIEVYLIYDNDDQDAKQQMQFYLKPYQRILLFSSLKHFNHNLKQFIISFFYSSGVQMNNSNFGKFLVASKGIEFFSRSDLDKNQMLCTQLVNNYNKLPLSNISKLLADEGVMIRWHMKLFVKVKKIKYFKIKLNCSNCKNEWQKGFKQCFNCKETKHFISYSIQVLVQDQYFLEQQAYLYLQDDQVVQFFNITEQEKKDIYSHLVKNETFMQLYYSINKEYSKAIIKFKDRIFTKDISKYVAAFPFADVANKILNSNQQAIQEEKQRTENEIFFKDFIGDDEDNNKFSSEMNKSLSRKQIFINGTYIASNLAQGQRVVYKPIPCLRVVHVFPQEDVKLQATKVLQEIQNLKIQMDSLK